MTAHVRAPSLVRPAADARVRGRPAERISDLMAIAAAAWLVGAAWSAAVAAALILVLSGSWEAAEQVLGLAPTFLVILAPAVAIWLIGAVETRRSVGRLRGAFERRDRAAFAELNALLARE